jgi:hypothetical protein
MVFPKPCLQHPVTGLVDSGQETSGVMRRTALQTKPRWLYGPDPIPDDNNTTSLVTPGVAINAIGLEDEKQNTIDGVVRWMQE